MAKVLTKPYMGGDWLIREADEQEFSRHSVTLDNSGGSTDLVVPAGSPVASATALAAAAVINVAPVAGSPTIMGATLEPVTVPKGEKAKVLYIGSNVLTGKFGNHVFNKDAIPAADTAGVAFTADFLRQHYVNLGWVSRAEPPTQSEQVS